MWLKFSVLSVLFWWHIGYHGAIKG